MTKALAHAHDLQRAMVEILGLPREQVTAITIRADVEHHAVRVDVTLLPSVDELERIIAAIQAHAPGVEVRLG